MIVKGSRYEKVPTYEVQSPDGRAVRVLGIRRVPRPSAGFVHTVGAEDRLDLLAFTFYGNPEKFWLIADANDAADPEDLLEPGRRLQIPPDRG